MPLCGGRTASAEVLRWDVPGGAERKPVWLELSELQWEQNFGRMGVTQGLHGGGPLSDTGFYLEPLQGPEQERHLI